MVPKQVIKQCLFVAFPFVILPCCHRTAALRTSLAVFLVLFRSMSFPRIVAREFFSTFTEIVSGYVLVAATDAANKLMTSVFPATYHCCHPYAALAEWGASLRGSRHCRIMVRGTFAPHPTSMLYQES